MKINMDPRLKGALEWVYCFIIAIVIALLIKFFIGTPTVVKHVSMKGTLEEGERLWLNRWVRTVNSEIKKGDIITFEAPSEAILSLEEVDFSNPVAIYENQPEGLYAKFNYYVLEKTKTSYIKRVIGTEGDKIKIADGRVYLNDQPLDEPYLKEGVHTYPAVFTEIEVPQGYVFVMGDNREHSTDSRAFGCIPLDKIESRVAFRFWPLSKFGGVE